jgi:7-keto-8-aminopelargonate synthetase-like enzyme/DNA-binding NarL/FixJ family response regulator
MANSSGAGASAPSRAQPKILLVEDNAANRDMLTRRLKRQGFEICLAVDGPSGVRTAAEENPDVILMDVALGEMDGWQATRLIKSRPSTAHIPIIALTAHALATDRDRSINNGCADFDTKPVDLTRLVGKIRACLMQQSENCRAHEELASRHYSEDNVANGTKRSDAYSANGVDPLEALTGSMRDFRNLRGKDLTGRVEGFFRWQDLRRAHGLWPYSKSTEEAPLATCAAKDDHGFRFRGLNFASQDYLGLSSDPEIKEVAKAVIDEYGVHSAGSSALAGNTKYSLKLEEVISQFLHLGHTVLYPTGWAAGYGVIKALVGTSDHVVMDGLSHACLQEGANSATKNVHLHGHLEIESVRRRLQRIRSGDAENGILVVTESLFSMDSDTPDLAALQDLCREFEATLLVDVAHDLGAIGERGRGFIGLQNMLGNIDIVMGSFSKTFASNGGFVSCNSPAVKQYLKFYGCSATFSNALSPVQAATVAKAFEIVQSDKGRDLRWLLMKRVRQLRQALSSVGFEVIGDPSAIVPVMAGDEALARMASRRLPELGVVANLVEYPAVAKGSARFRLQVMPNHTTENVIDLAKLLRAAVDSVQAEYERYLERLGDRPQALRLAVGE